jgi:hypothetical protein
VGVRRIGDAVRQQLIEVAVTEEFAEYDLLGYRDLAGEYVPSRYMERLNDGDPDRDVYILLLDEMNLAPFDAYGAKLVAAITNRIAVDLPGSSKTIPWFPDNGEWTPHNGVVVIGTMNSYLEDPSRKQLSVPIKRRSNLIMMPDPLLDIVQRYDSDDAPDEFAAVCRLLLTQLVSRLRRRGLSVLESSLVNDLTAAVPTEAIALLWRLSRRLAPSDEVAMTLGLVQSILRYVQTSHFDNVATALDLQIEQKILPTLRGPADLLARVKEALGPGDWPRTLKTVERMRRLADDNANRLRPLA